MQFTQDQFDIRLLFLRYRAFLVPFSVIVVSIAVFFIVIVPQIQAWFSERQEADTLARKITILQKNTNLLATINDQTLSQDTLLTLTALPFDKDFTGILYAIQSASIRSGVGLGDFSFQVGELSSGSARLSKQPSLEIALSINGNAQGMQRFVEELANTLPISEVKAVTAGERSGSAIVTFYYRPLSDQKINFASPLKELSAKNQELLVVLKEMEENVSRVDFSTSSSSPSASPF